ncbi:hypothetical protein FA727_06135 [Robertmurraya kyonggiensis]|uniref:PqqD family protein n=1 Tax=Robertmurraya kyonggiensis TaxID=1037680 RepID=A0A4U1D9F3_9BACI|nr:hypothetical protein FA727_06135 [Robertmurraya kyonggiensis]
MLKVKLNPDLTINDFEDGKIIIVNKTNEGYYIERFIYDLLLNAKSDFVDVKDIDKNFLYSGEELEDFIRDLVFIKILLMEEI